MGISGILPKILPSAGRENYDLRALADGLIVVVASSFPPSPSTTAANEADTLGNTHGDDDGDDVGHGRGDDNGSVREAKRRKLLPSFSFQSTPSTAQRSTTWKRRKFRVAIDIHGWIARAAHGNGACLLDERHLSYYGRNELGMELEKLRTDNNGSVENCNVGNGDAIPEEQNDHLQKQREQQRLLQEQRQLEFIIKCTNFVLHRLEYLQEHCQVDILPVLDGKTPPCKRETVKLRAGKKEEASFVRDGHHIAVRETNIPAAASNAAEDETITTDEAAATEAEALRKIAASKRAGATYNPPNETDACDESNEKRPTIQQQLTKELLKEFRRRKYPFLQSPYEADGQLAYLANRRLVDLVITEDSDLIALGVETLVYRLKGGNCDDDGILEANNHHYNTSDTGNGNPFADTNYGNSNTNRNFTTPLKGTILHRKDLGSSHGIDLLDFSNAMLATMFVAAGCDYCDSLIGIGIATARNAVKRAFHGSAEADGIYRFGGRRFRGGSGGGIDDDDDDDDFDDDNDGGRMPVLKKVLNELFRSCQKIDRGRFLPLHDPAKEEARNSYERSFLRALAMFRHPLVYDPILCRNVISNDVSEGEGDSHNSSNYQGAQGGVRATPSFMRDEEILMEYQPYRELVTNRKLLYGAVGTPFSPDIARKIAEGLLDPRTVQCTNVENHNSNHTTCDNPPQEYDNHDNYDEYAKTSSTKTIEHSSTRLEADETTNAAPFAYFTQDSHSNQPSSSYNSQENFIGGGKGTEQSKSTSSGTSTGLISSLSPDLLASPSPVKYYV